MTWSFNKIDYSSWYIRLPRTLYKHNTEVQQRWMEKCLKWKNRGNVEALRGSAERAMNFPPTVQTGREALCVAVELVQPPFREQKPLNTRTSNQNVSESQTAKMVGLASGADLVCWGPLKLHIILVFIIFSHRATALTQGLFVSVCLLCPLNPPTAPTPPLLSTEHIWHRASPLAEEYQRVNGSPFPLRLSLWFSFGQRRLLAGGDVCRPHENVSLFPQKATLHQPHVLTAHFAAQMSSVKSTWPDRIPTCSWNFFRLILFVGQLKLKCDLPSSPAVDGWMVIKGQGGWKCAICERWWLAVVSTQMV